jgi:chemotaxis protein histidine kinase CheA
VPHHGRSPLRHKNGEIDIDGDLVDILLSTVDRITDIVKQIESADNDNVKIDDLVEAFQITIKQRTKSMSLIALYLQKISIISDNNSCTAASGKYFFKL